MHSLDSESFDTALADAQGLVLVDFWAPWCGPCRVITPLLETIEAQYEEEAIDFYKVNVEENPVLLQAFKLSSIPAVLLLKPHDEGAKVLGALIGAQSIPVYLKWIESHLHPKPSLFTRLKNIFTRSDTA